MCDYSLHHVKSRPAKVGDKLRTVNFNTGTRGFAAPEDSATAVCVLPGTELAFVPLFADTKIERPGQDNGRAPLIGMPMRHDLDARRQLGSLNVHTCFGRVAVQDCILRPGA